MDSKTTIIGMIICVIIILPIVYIQFTQNRKNKNNHKNFMAEALKQNFNITTVDFWGTFYAIAMDQVQSKLIYSNKSASENVWQVIDLNTVSECYVDKTDRKVKNKTTNKVETDKIDLIIVDKTQKHILEFYNVDVNVEMTGEMALLQKWIPLIHSYIEKPKLVA